MTEKMTKSITCDHCEKELLNNPRRGYCLELRNRDVLCPMDASMLTSSTIAKPLSETKHFCNLECLAAAIQKGFLP